VIFKIRVACICCLLSALVLSTGACVMKSHLASDLTLSEWGDLRTFTPVILWPEPEGIGLLFPPRYLEDREYVELVYSEGFVASGVETPMYTLYESYADIPLGRSFLPDYVLTNSRVITREVYLDVAGVAIEAQIRENTRLPESGVAIFELEGTHIVFHWRHKPSAAALAMLEQNLVQVEQDDAEIILSFDHVLNERFLQHAP